MKNIKLKLEGTPMILEKKGKKLSEIYPETFKIIFKQLSELLDKCMLCENFTYGDLKDKCLNDIFCDYIIKDLSLSKIGFNFSIDDILFRIQYNSDPISYYQVPTINIDSFNYIQSSNGLDEIIKNRMFRYIEIQYKLISLHLVTNIEREIELCNN